ncbi:MAG: RNA-binding domain-containing protein [Candidatus Caldarchaeales archaeon]
MRVRIVAEVKPTEDQRKVLAAVSRLFPEVRFEVRERGGSVEVCGESDQLSSLKYLKENLRRRKVRAAAERIIRSYSGTGYVRMVLSKQAAYVGTVSFLEEDEIPEIGWIDVYVETEDPEGLIGWLTER